MAQQFSFAHVAQPAPRRSRWRRLFYFSHWADRSICASRPRYGTSFWASELAQYPTIAVLPFDDPRAADDQLYLADVISNEVRTALSKFPDLVVMGRNSTLKYKGKPADIRQVGKELNVLYVVEGTIDRADPNVQVTAELIDASTGKQIWTHQYEQQANQPILAFRDVVTRSIAGTLGGVEGVLAEAEFNRVSEK